MYCITYLHVLTHSVAIHTPDFRDKEKHKHATVNTTNLPNGLKKIWIIFSTCADQ